MVNVDENYFQKLYAKTTESLIVASVALFNQVLLREVKKEQLDVAITKTSSMIEDIIKVSVEGSTTENVLYQMLDDEEKKRVLNSVNAVVKEGLKSYVYKSYTSELISEIPPKKSK